MKRYNPKEVEPKWQKIWDEQKLYKADDSSSLPKYYALSFFPYPSGVGLHIGHTRNFTITDVVARFKRMNGHAVLHPMGWDSFGLPGENYAIKTGINPKITTKENTSNFRAQCKMLGLSIDWDREFSSTDPEYYKWTQWFFKLLFERGLAYQQESAQFWCDECKTVLANEQVVNGCCWRHEDKPVSKKMLKQWFFKITDYADRLEADLDGIDWPEGIKQMQRNWIGRSKGAEIDFRVDGFNEKLRVFTTRPDTLFGATFMVVAPEHPILSSIVASEQKATVDTYVAEAQRKSEIDRMDQNREKTGVFTGAYAVNPVNNEKIPIWVADYVLMGYGTGAIMAVPAHDERDHEFAKKFDLPVVQVVAERFVDVSSPHLKEKKLVERNVVCCIVKHPTESSYIIVKPVKGTNWSPLMGGIDDGETAEQAALRELTEETGFTNVKSLAKKGDIFASEFFATHKDVNRIAYCQTVYIELGSLDQDMSKAVSLDEQEIKWVDEAEYRQLPSSGGVHKVIDLALDTDETAMSLEGRLINSNQYNGLQTSDAREKIVEDLMNMGVGIEKINYKIRDWLISRQRYWGAPIPIVHCEEHGAVAVPDDQLPVVLPDIDDFQPSGDGQSPLAKAADWVNTTCPVCGGPATRETDTMDGFACSSWYFLRFADARNNESAFSDELAKKWLPVDMYVGGAEHAVMHLLYARMWTKVMQDAGLINFNEPFVALRNQGMLLAEDGQKISKSKGNDIKPDEIVEQGYGADALRTIVLFLAPFDQSTPWSSQGLAGVYRFLQRVWNLTQEYLEANVQPGASHKDLQVAMHKATHRVTKDLHELGFNTAIAGLMEYVNELYRIKAAHGFVASEWREALSRLVQLLAPFAPHMTEELWQQIGGSESVHTSEWPQWDESLLVKDVITLAIQINGKVRAEIEVNADESEEAIIEAALKQERIQELMNGSAPKKTFYVKNRLVSIVL